ncbi:hypothetical protein OG875_05085 [Streptomyces sp. NBC_01498]|uniref:hypothetical protein n=1 Tax=Streptomyces sp. NBC_01498 TaxID=2975870 RepID=UPI002E7AB3F9|nr:hypothetical protein [Streptomyces sp. NBC_01498]WTL24032.1 hypothetical protein OG875_05085 [Streptomyces sp. NBC_01498]
MTTTTATTATHLRLIISHWPDLADALAASNVSAWPPSGLRAHLAAVEREETDEDEARRHRDATARAHEGLPTPLAITPAPLVLGIYDTMRTVEQLLLATADATAEHVQRPPMPMPAPRRAAYAKTRADRVAWADHARRVQAAQDDAADPRRWSWTGRRPDGRYAALWLLGRVTSAPGPFRPLTPAQEEHIATAARLALGRVERALDLAARQESLRIPCPDCAGTISIHGGSGAAPVARCTACGRTWSETGLAA